MVGPLGVKLTEAFESFHIIENKYSINDFGMLVYHLCAYFSYEKSLIGEIVPTKIFNIEELAEKFRDLKQSRTKFKEFVRF